MPGKVTEVYAKPITVYLEVEGEGEDKCSEEQTYEQEIEPAVTL